MTNHNQTLLIGALLGGFVGAAAVLLSTPYSGAKLRSKILNGLPHETPKTRHTLKPAKRKKTQLKTATHKSTKRKSTVNHKH